MFNELTLEEIVSREARIEELFSTEKYCYMDLLDWAHGFIPFDQVGEIRHCGECNKCMFYVFEPEDRKIIEKDGTRIGITISGRYRLFGDKRNKYRTSDNR